jgi:hypothetical protein
MKVIHLVFALGAASLGLSACGGDDEGSSVSSKDYPNALADATCGGPERCGCPERETNGCRELVTRNTNAEVVDAESFGLQFDASCAGRRIDRIKADECRPTTSPTTSRPRCADYCAVFYGDVKNGGRCTNYAVGDSSTSASDCAPGLVCSGASTGISRCLPYCDLFPDDDGLGADGDPCGLYGGLCGEGLTCYDERCSPRVPLGQQCAGQGVLEKRCVADAQCLNDVCVTLPGLDEPCSSAGTCRSGYECSYETVTCVASPPRACVGYGGP